EERGRFHPHPRAQQRGERIGREGVEGRLPAEGLAEKSIRPVFPQAPADERVDGGIAHDRIREAGEPKNKKKDATGQEEKNSKPREVLLVSWFLVSGWATYPATCNPATR